MRMLQRLAAASHRVEEAMDLSGGGLLFADGFVSVRPGATDPRDPICCLFGFPETAVSGSPSAARAMRHALPDGDTPDSPTPQPSRWRRRHDGWREHGIMFAEMERHVTDSPRSTWAETYVTQRGRYCKSS